LFSYLFIIKFLNLFSFRFIRSEIILNFFRLFLLNWLFSIFLYF
jgi:hypothetical protein